MFTLSLEFLAGAVLGAVYVLLPMTPALYGVIALLVLAVVGHIAWRLTGIWQVTKETARLGISALAVLPFGVLLAWGAYVRFAEAATPPLPGGGNITIQGSNYGTACTNGANCEINKTTVEISGQNPNLLYQSNDDIGRISSEPEITKNRITFRQLRMTGYIDPNIPVVFRKMALACPQLDAKALVQASAMFMDIWAKVVCKIVDEKQVKTR